MSRATGGAVLLQLVLWIAADAAWAGREHQRLRHLSRNSEDLPSCSCDCCGTVRRRPDEVVGSAAVKCAPAGGHSSDVCGGAQCSSTNDALEHSEGQLDYQRFCFFECKPALGLASFPETQCIALDATDLRLVLDVNGNPQDPAVVYARLPQASTVSSSPDQALVAAKRALQPAQEAPVEEAPADAVAVAEESTWAESTASDSMEETAAVEETAAAAVNSTPGEAAESSSSGDAVVEKARGTAISGASWASAMAGRARQAAVRTRDGEAMESHLLNDRLHMDDPDSGNDGAIDPFTASDDIRFAADNSQAAAERAALAASSAVAAVREARYKNWPVALDTAEAEIHHYQEELAKVPVGSRNASRAGAA
mmetsp:Transcript_32885/g.71766  ORF Transcript_32885/g.71766 Transcript_32885/m.71766 type:complete len:368 (-) Transcript_32885:139-1242(-)|eukprot:CAMPEP_0170625674 /NCGR_PEP_ID=MMETSP0224-20130122/30892_1 /TAXON_ID=285029 /ORGANISM="Togula jolla, Strain CCCM 725" /LENGTH=367 /DNA_ID=CAMNT_0010952279 /DNA_START=21 /DNA_END=1124 /DNA_ORIENTATION=-